MRDISFRKIWSVCRREYYRWLLNPKWFMLLLLVIPIRECIILPLLQASGQIDEPLNLLEPCIAMANSGLVVFLLPLGYMVLMMEFPHIDANMSWYVCRVGRKNWILGELLFEWLSVVSYLGFYMLTVILHVWQDSFWGNGWSFVITRYDVLYTFDDKIELSEIVPLNLFYQMPPYKAFILSYILQALFLLLFARLLCLAALYAKRIYMIVGIIVSLALGIGFASSAFAGKWLFFFEHAILWLHYQRLFRDYVFSPYISIAIFALLNLILAAAMLLRALSVSIDILWEENTDG